MHELKHPLGYLSLTLDSFQSLCVGLVDGILYLLHCQLGIRVAGSLDRESEEEEVV